MKPELGRGSVPTASRRTDPAKPSAGEVARVRGFCHSVLAPGNTPCRQTRISSARSHKRSPDLSVISPDQLVQLACHGDHDHTWEENQLSFLMLTSSSKRCSHSLFSVNDTFLGSMTDFIFFFFSCVYLQGVFRG